MRLCFTSRDKSGALLPPDWLIGRIRTFSDEPRPAGLGQCTPRCRRTNSIAMVYSSSVGKDICFRLGLGRRAWGIVPIGPLMLPIAIWHQPKMAGTTLCRRVGLVVLVGGGGLFSTQPLYWPRGAPCDNATTVEANSSGNLKWALPHLVASLQSGEGTKEEQGKHR